MELMCRQVTLLKRLAIFPYPAGMSLTKLSLAGITKFPARESLVSDIPAGDGKIAKLFYSGTSSAVSLKAAKVAATEVRTEKTIYFCRTPLMSL